MKTPRDADNFNPDDWTTWAHNLLRALRVGGVWGAPSPGFVVRKDSDDEVTVIVGALDARTAQVFKAAGITVNHLPGLDPLNM